MADYYVSHAGLNQNARGNLTDAARNLLELISYVTGVGGPGWKTSDRIFVLNTHVYNYVSSTSLAFPATFKIPVVCVNNAGVPQPTGGVGGSASVGTESTTGASNIAFSGCAYFYGLKFIAGNTTASSVINVGSQALVDTSLTFHNCVLRLGSSLAGNGMNIGAMASGLSSNHFEFIDTAFEFGDAGQRVRLAAGLIELMRCKTNGAVAPGAVFDLQSAIVRAEGGSYTYGTSLMTTTNDECGYFFGRNLKTSNATMTSGTIATPCGGPTVDIQCYGSTADAWRDFKAHVTGTVAAVSDIYLDASVGMTGANGSNVKTSLQMASSANCGALTPLYTKWIPKRILSTGSKTISVKVCYDGSLLTTADLFVEVQYMGGEAEDTSADVGLVNSAPKLTSPISATGSGNIVVRNFTSTGSQLSDTGEAWTGTGAFQAKKTHTLSATVTVDQQGAVMVRVGLTKASTTVYVAPDVTVS